MRRKLLERLMVLRPGDRVEYRTEGGAVEVRTVRAAPTQVDRERLIHLEGVIGPVPLERCRPIA